LFSLVDEFDMLEGNVSYLDDWSKPSHSWFTLTFEGRSPTRD
jgi:hypothetical protein